MKPEFSPLKKAVTAYWNELWNDELRFGCDSFDTCRPSKGTCRCQDAYFAAAIIAYLDAIQNDPVALERMSRAAGVSCHFCKAVAEALKQEVNR